MDWINRHRAVVLGAAVALVGTLDSLLSLIERVQAGGLNFGEVISFARLVSGPLALALVVVLWRRTQPRFPGDSVRPEWASATQPEHWEGLRSLAVKLMTEYRRTVADETTVTVAMQNELRNKVDALDFQVSNYSEMWQVGSYWSERDRGGWPRRANLQNDPAWALPLGERISYASWWLSRHSPYDPFDQEMAWHES